MLPVSWPVVGSLLPVFGGLYLIAYLRRHLGKPGVNWFIVTLSAVVLWSGSYGVSLLVFDPQLRLALEMLTWTAMMATGISFLAFGLDYTGRGYMARSRWFGLLVAVPVVTIALVWTNPLHQLVWSGFQIDPVFGAATVSYEFGAVAYFAVLVGMVFVTAGMLVLFETVLGYGPLFRSEALAVALSAVAPGIALLAWLTEIGPYPQLNLTAVMFLPHLALDAYAFVGSGMFEFSPSTRRTAQRRAIDDLDDPVVVVNTDGMVVEYNPAAAAAFDVDDVDPLGEPLAAILGPDVDVDLEGSNQLVEYRATGEFREFSVSSSSLTGPSKAQVGSVLVFQDVTERRRRKQRLTVMNRVLRHNLRNDLNVVSGYVDLAQELTDDDQVADYLGRAKTDVESVLEMGEKARDFERAVDALESPPTTVAVRSLIADLGPAADATGSGPSEAGSVLELSIPESLELETNERVFEALFANLIENGVEHSDADCPRVTVGYEGLEDGSTAVFTVRDNGSGIPDHELAVIERGEETPLSHGSGLGLWIVRWCATALGGDLTFDTGSDGTTVTIRLPSTDATAQDHSSSCGRSGLGSSSTETTAGSGSSSTATAGTDSS